MYFPRVNALPIVHNGMLRIGNLATIAVKQQVALRIAHTGASRAKFQCNARQAGNGYGLFPKIKMIELVTRQGMVVFFPQQPDVIVLLGTPGYTQG